MVSGFHIFQFRKIHLKMACTKLRPFCLGLNVCKTVFDDHIILSTGMVQVVKIFPREIQGPV